jgi:GDP-L-fucose synthase
MVGSNLLEHPLIDTVEVMAPGSRELDLRDYPAVLAYMNSCQPDLVIHAAGKVGGIQANIQEPVGFFLENLDMGRNVVWAARQAGVTQLLNLGSSCMYPRDHDEPLREEMVLKGALEPTNEGYALAKVATSRLCEYISGENPVFQYKTLIPCNLYGRHDKFDPASSHLVPAIIHKIHVAKTRQDDSVEIWGNGTARREFMYAGDLADALLRCISQFKTVPSVMNVGLGHDYTINQYYETVANVLGYSGSFFHNLSKPVGMARKLVNVEKQTQWGWQPAHSLRMGIEKTYAFYLREFAQ